jgi:uncharacterized membrane protein
MSKYNKNNQLKHVQVSSELNISEEKPFLYKLIFPVGEYFNSLEAIIILMLLILIAGAFISHVLFYRAFPNDMLEHQKIIASWLFAAVWEFTVLLTAANKDLLPKNATLIFAVCSGIILLFFVNAFDPHLHQSASSWSQSCFAAILFGVLNYMYSELFVKKWQQIKSKDLDSKVIELESVVNEFSIKLNQAEAALNETEAKLIHFEQLEQERIKELTCPHCHNFQETYGRLVAHKGHCPENPKNKKECVPSEIQNP